MPILLQLKDFGANMRSIKFRAWDKVGKKMYYDVTPYSAASNTILKDGGILMQFTGLEDKNGKEGYFGDIVEDEGDRYIVDWDEDCGVAYLNSCLLSSIDLEIEAIKNREIIGNIHENPEILNKE